MSTGQPNTTDKSSLSREEANGSTPAKAADFVELAQQIKKLVEKLEAPKRKSIWDAISADGAIWLGVPLDQEAIQAAGHNKTAVSVMLFLDGNKGLPTDAQRASLVLLLCALFRRLKIDASANAPDGVGFHFHRDYSRFKNCPGLCLQRKWSLAGCRRWARFPGGSGYLAFIQTRTVKLS